MFGNLGENEKTMQDTINFAKSLDLDTATFHITIPFPNTDYWNIIKKKEKYIQRVIEIILLMAMLSSNMEI